MVDFVVFGTAIKNELPARRANKFRVKPVRDNLANLSRRFARKFNTLHGVPADGN